jgi:pilus assembly protein CpaE
MWHNAARMQPGCRGRSLAQGTSRLHPVAKSSQVEAPEAIETQLPATDSAPAVEVEPQPQAVEPKSKAPAVEPELPVPILVPQVEHRPTAQVEHTATVNTTMPAGTVEKYNLAMGTSQQAEGLGSNLLSVRLVGPDTRRRLAVAEALAGSPCQLSEQMASYPDLDQAAQVQEDVVIIDLDSDVEMALELVETICASQSTTVMVYSANMDSEVMLRSMRAGAREFLTFPPKQSALTDAIVRAAARRSTLRTPKKSDGRLHVFCGAKGGTGVTTIATNFAVTAARETSGKVLLMDLDMPLGDAALQLGITPQYSTADALQNAVRLDANFLSRLLAKHESGLFLLAAPGTFASYQLNAETVSKLLQVARAEFDVVIVDAGSRFQLHGTALFDPDSLVYLVTDVGVSELRNANRIVSELFPATRPKLEVILNRFAPTTLGMDEEHITRALTRPAQWRIPEDKATVREMQNTATPLASRDTPVSRAIRQLARAACGLSDEPEKKRKILGLF